MDDLNPAALARDAAYTAIGFCVLGFQQMQVRRRELTGELATRMAASGATQNARSGLQQVLRRADAVVDPVLDEVERALPAAARTAVHQSRAAAKVLRKVLL